MPSPVDIRDAPEVLAEAGDVLGTLADAGPPRISGASCSLLLIDIYEVEVKHVYNGSVWLCFARYAMMLLLYRI